MKRQGGSLVALKKTELVLRFLAVLSLTAYLSQKKTHIQSNIKQLPPT